MNSLVVLFSLVALTAAKPSGLLHSEVLSYSAPAIAAIPAAVSSQSRIDIKSSPAVVTTADFTPIARTVIAEPAVISAPAAIAPAAVSHQSRIDIKSSPAVVSNVVTPLATAAIAPTIFKTAIEPAYLKTIAAPAAIHAFPVLKTAFAAPIFAAPAAISAHAELAPAVPLDTPEVIAARAAHFEAKALAEAHSIHKRSASLIAAPGFTTYAAPFYSTYAASPLIHTAPITYSNYIHTPLINKAYSVHPW